MGHSASDPVSTALTLLEQALAGALAGIQAAAAAQGTPAASVSGASSPDSGTSGSGSTMTSAITASGKGEAAALDVLLTQNSASDPKNGLTSPQAADGSSVTAAPAAAASTAAAGLTAAAQLSAAPHLGSQPGTTSPAMTLASPVGTSAWTDELGTKLTWMAHQGIESASLHLSPEHLGPLQVSISVHNGQASVWFGAAQPDTRTALQQSLPQLRQLFASQGLTLADSGVSREPPRGQGQQSSGRSAAPVSGITGVSLESAGSGTAVARGLGLLDTYV
jgi:flagellar hook-length control protein FliK